MIFRKKLNDVYWYCPISQLFKRRNVATVEDDGIPEDDGMADSGYLESQANNMDPLVVRGETFIESIGNDKKKTTLLSSCIHNMYKTRGNLNLSV